ncbi:hypothetical protein BDZ89DRAFT_1003023, partial [Hymenopellis radicata]
MVPPHYNTTPISPIRMKRRFEEVLEIEPQTCHERDLRDSLIDSQENERALKRRLVEVQTGMVMANVYVGQTQTQLQEDEERKKQKGKGSNRLNADGMPKLFTGPEFMSAAQKHHDDREAKEKEKEQRVEEGTKYTADLGVWKKEEAERVERNNQRRSQHKTALAAWKVESDRAKSQKRRAGWLKPKLGDLEKGRPKPKKQTAVALPSTSRQNGDDED